MPLCLESDAADKLPGNIGTREDIGTLLRNSQYIAEGIPNRGVNPVVQGGLNCLHYKDVFGEQFGRVRKLWVYLHGGYEERHSYIPARNEFGRGRGASIAIVEIFLGGEKNQSEGEAIFGFPERKTERSKER